MKKIILLILGFLCLNCNSKAQNSNAELEEKSVEQIKKPKLNGKQIVEDLEKLNFFNLTNKSELSAEKVDIEKTYNDLNFFEGKMRGETLDFINNRFYVIDSEELFEVGGLTNYLKILKLTFDKLGLKLNYSNEKSNQNEKYWKHTIELNGKEYIAFDNNFGENDWGIAYVKFIEMLNTELQAQNSEERIFPISAQNDGRIVMLTEKQFKFVKENFPNDKEHPKTLENWKNEYGIK